MSSRFVNKMLHQSTSAKVREELESPSLSAIRAAQGADKPTLSILSPDSTLTNTPTPRRIQRKRTKGWRMPPNTVCVTRPGKWGNKFAIGDYAMMGDPGGHSGPFQMSYCITSKEYADSRYTHIKDAATAVEWFRRYLDKYPRTDIAELRGKNLACFCPEGSPCHADVLLEIANAS